MTRLSYSERDVLDAVDLAPMGWTPHPELARLFQLGLVQAQLVRWATCFYAEVSTTPQGAAVARGLN